MSSASVRESISLVCLSIELKTIAPAVIPPYSRLFFPCNGKVTFLTAICLIDQLITQKHYLALTAQSRVSSVHAQFIYIQS